MPSAELVSSPGESYSVEVLDALSDASRFVLVTAFASLSGLERLQRALGDVIARGGDGEIVLAVDRRGFNTSALFDALLALREAAGPRLSLGLVLESSGLLHAKALYVEGPRGPRLIVGSANLTRSAFEQNHELGVLIRDAAGDVRSAFRRFVRSIPRRELNGPDARAFLATRGLATAEPPREAAAERKEQRAALEAAFALLPEVAPLETLPEEHVRDFIWKGFLVGRGRRSLDALVLRVPLEQLYRQGDMVPPRRKALGRGSHETRTLGFAVDLVPEAEGGQLRRDARRVTLLLAKLTLNLPCFGAWMPESYWDVFLEARSQLKSADALRPERVREVAAAQRAYLLGGGLEQEVERILDSAENQEILVAGRREALGRALRERFRREIEARTPEVLMSCVQFRTARQRWAPFEQTEAPHRQVMVDVVQATLWSTYRTGDWPRASRSHAARRVAERVTERVLAGGGEADGSTALALLDAAATWEDPARPLSEVVNEYRRLIGDDLTFPAPSLEELNAPGGGSEDEATGGDEE